MKKSEESPIDRTLRWADERGWDQSELARRLGVEPGHVTNWKKVRGLPKARYEAVATLFGRTLDEVAGRAPEEPRDKSARRTDDRLMRVPVRGTAQLDKDGCWREPETPAQTGGGYIDMPSRDRNAYAVRMVGDSMHPRIEAGEYVLVEPSSPLIPNEEVLVVTKDGRNMIRKFLSRRNGLIFLQNVAGTPLTLPEDDVVKIHYVAAIARSSWFLEEKDA